MRRIVCEKAVRSLMEYRRVCSTPGELLTAPALPRTSRTRHHEDILEAEYETLLPEHYSRAPHPIFATVAGQQPAGIYILRRGGTGQRFRAQAARFASTLVTAASASCATGLRTLRKKLLG